MAAQGYRLLIGGERLAGDDGAYEVIDPASEEVVGEAPEASIAQVEAAAAAAAEAFPAWSRTYEALVATLPVEPVWSADEQAGYGEQMKGLTVVIGNAPEASGDKVVALGKCAAELQGADAYVKGCPPKEDAMVRAIAEVCGVDADAVMTTMADSRKKLWDTSSSALNR